MFRTALLGCFLVLWTGLARAQELLSAQFLGSRTASQLIAEFGVPFVQYGAEYYRITYTTVDAQGAPTIASGLLAAPDQGDKIYPRLVYQHGTSSSKLDVPSFNVLQNGEGRVGLLLAGLGYVAFLPDYVGLGVSPGFHPYVHAATEASCALDMLRACVGFCEDNGILYNEQLFITGYSQGGHAGMALHRQIEQDQDPDLTVTAAAHLSGPYSISGVMRDLILSDSVYFYPGYLPNTALSYQTAYGNLFNDLEELFRPPYAGLIGQFYAGQINLGQLNGQLIAALTAQEGASIPTRMLQPDAIAAVQSDPAHPINLALADNDVYNWAPQAPTRIFYCQADDQVPYRNSVVARDAMLFNGASDLVAADLNPTANHGACVTPALTATVFFFAAFQQVTTAAGEALPVAAEVSRFRVYPNPVSDRVYLSALYPGAVEATLFDMHGRMCRTAQSDAGELYLSLENLQPGPYFLRCAQGGVLEFKRIWRVR